jgi:hypothetical protein
MQRYRRNKVKEEGYRNRVPWMDVKNLKFCKKGGTQKDVKKKEKKEEK